MINIEAIEAVTNSPLLLEFSAFIIGSAENRRYPRYGAIDLMQIPRAVPNIFIFDYRNGIGNGLVMKFTGTEIDYFYKQNGSGKTADEVYKGDDHAALIERHYKGAYRQKKTAYSCRNVEFEMHMVRIHSVESVIFQCAEDDENLDFAIGIVDFAADRSVAINTYRFLD